MPSSIVSRKRKADALEADALEADDSATDGARKSGPDADSQAHLPSTCLAAVLNFMRYTDVRQCMLAGKMMAVEAARHVETLNITKASELVVPAARRFGNVTTVNVLCLISEISEDNRDDQISFETATRVVPFLSSIPNLERVFLGGLYRNRHATHAVMERYRYDIDCVEPSDHQNIFKTLVESVIGGFQSKSLPQSLELGGVLVDGQLECADNGTEDPDHPCRFCRHLLSSFPLHLLVMSIPLDWAFCVSRADRIRAVLRRDGTAATLRSSYIGTDMLLGCLKYEIYRSVMSLWLSSKSEIDQAFIQKMRAQEAACDRMSMSLYGKISLSESFKDLLDLVKSSPLLQDFLKSIPRDKLLETFVIGSPTKVGKTIFARQLFDALLEAGLQMDACDCIIVDPEKEPALARQIEV